MRARTGIARRRLVAALAACVFAVAVEAHAGEGAAPPTARWPQLATGPLQDNSFLLEEAYNQDAGVVQHIATATRDRKTRNWLASFTQEWPVFGADHQLSYLVPYQSQEEGKGGVGDVLLNYRYQLSYEGARRPACTPRISLILPTGSARAGLGTGSAGVEIAVAASKQLDERWAAHLNVGTTIIPDAHASSGPPRRESLLGRQGGGSIIWEPADAINLLCEVLVSDDADVGVRGVRRSTRVTLSPGIRIAWNGPAGTQWVWGIATPTGLTRKSDDFGVLLYFSIEHAFTAAAHRARWP